MGQRADSISKPRAISLFETELGCCALVGAGQVVSRVIFGHSSPDVVLSLLSEEFSECPVRDWNPNLRKQLQRFVRGKDHGDFSQTLTVETEKTPFASRVIEAVRQIPPGEVRSYAEVAEAAGSSKACRAVGNIMARNPIPIIIPCHRVVASGGRPGGYTSPQGKDLKVRLLELEAIHRK